MDKNIQENNVNSGRRMGKDRRSRHPADYFGLERRCSERRSGEEIRRYDRFKVKDYVYVNLRSESGEEVGQLLDIGRGGLSLQFLAFDQKPKTYNNLGILANMELAVEHIPFRTVSITEVVNDVPLSVTRMIRYGLEFAQLTPEQEAKIDYFIRNYTYGYA